MEPPTIPHMTRHGIKAKSIGDITAKTGLCIMGAKYATLIETITVSTNREIFFLVLIFELHDIISLSCLMVSHYVELPVILLDVMFMIMESSSLKM